MDFYKAFWVDVGPLLFASLKHAQKTGQLSISQKRAVIKLIPKRDKNPQFVQNLRPITLLNVDVKIFTRALSIHLKDILQEIIGLDQQAFIQGRYIGNSVLDFYTMAVAALDSDDDINYVALSLDIEKAFDSIKWDFLYAFMQCIGIPDEFIQNTKLLHKGKELRVFNNGHASPPHNGKQWTSPGMQSQSIVIYFVHGITCSSRVQ